MRRGAGGGGVDDQAQVAARRLQHVAVQGHRADVRVVDLLARTAIERGAGGVPAVAELRAHGVQAGDQVCQLGVSGVGDLGHAQVPDQRFPEQLALLGVDPDAWGRFGQLVPGQVA